MIGLGSIGLMTSGLVGEKVEKLGSIYGLAKSHSPIGAGAVELKHVLCQVDASMG